MAELKITERMQNLVEETSHTVTGAPRRLLQASRGAISMTREEAEHLLERGEDLFEKLVERGQKIEEKQTERVQGWLKSWEERSRKQMHVAEEQFEHQVQNALRALHIPSADDVERLDKEIERISKMLDKRLAERVEGEMPIVGYDEMTVKEVLPLLDDLSEEQLETVRAYEVSHDNRVTILREIESKLNKPEAEAEAA